MTTTKLIVAYPQPANVEDFERAYQEEHVPLALDKLRGMKIYRYGDSSSDGHTSGYFGSTVMFGLMTSFRYLTQHCIK